MPSWVDITIERPHGPSYRMTLERSALEYQACLTGELQGGLTERLRPHPQAWREFLTAVEAAGARQWALEYTDPHSDDLTRWSVEIVTLSGQVSSSGTGAYPPGKAFQRLCEAVSILLDGRPFA
ncbi:MAG: hypothetical protein ACYDBB_11490 [Armatimonadota bacterium]